MVQNHEQGPLIFSSCLYSKSNIKMWKHWPCNPLCLCSLCSPNRSFQIMSIFSLLIPEGTQQNHIYFPSLFFFHPFCQSSVFLLFCSLPREYKSFALFFQTRPTSIVMEASSSYPHTFNFSFTFTKDYRIPYSLISCGADHPTSHVPSPIKNNNIQSWMENFW